MNQGAEVDEKHSTVKPNDDAVRSSSGLGRHLVRLGIFGRMR